MSIVGPWGWINLVVRQNCFNINLLFLTFSFILHRQLTNIVSLSCTVFRGAESPAGPLRRVFLLSVVRCFFFFFFLFSFFKAKCGLFFIVQQRCLGLICYRLRQKLHHPHFYIPGSENKMRKRPFQIQSWVMKHVVYCMSMLQIVSFAWEHTKKTNLTYFSQLMSLRDITVSG